MLGRLPAGIPHLEHGLGSGLGIGQVSAGGQRRRNIADLQAQPPGRGQGGQAANGQAPPAHGPGAQLLLGRHAENTSAGHPDRGDSW